MLVLVLPLNHNLVNQSSDICAELCKHYLARQTLFCLYQIRPVVIGFGQAVEKYEKIGGGR